MNEHFYKIGNINKETYILGHRNTNMYLNDKYVFEKSSPTVSNTISYEVHKLLIVVKKFCILGKLSWWEVTGKTAFFVIFYSTWAHILTPKDLNKGFPTQHYNFQLIRGRRKLSFALINSQLAGRGMGIGRIGCP